MFGNCYTDQTRRDQGNNVKKVTKLYISVKLLIRYTTRVNEF